MSDRNLFTLKIITPERVFYDGPVAMVEFNTTEGQIGVYQNHIPLTTIIAPGVLIITEEDGEKEAALHAGFAEILPDSVTIMDEIIEWPGEIDKERALEAKRRAEERIAQKSTSTDIDRASYALKRAISRIDVI